MTALLDAAALVVSATAVLAAGAALLSTGRLGVAVPVLLDLLLAASLLRLAAEPGLPELSGAALLVVVKRLAASAIRLAAAARRPQPGVAGRAGVAGGAGGSG